MDSQIAARREADLNVARDRLSGLLAADADREEVLLRFDRWSADLWDGLAEVYEPAAVLQAENRRPCRAHADGRLVGLHIDDALDRYFIGLPFGHQMIQMTAHRRERRRL